MTEQKKFIVYVGPFAFPNGGAAAKRIYGNCKTLLSLGCDVTIASGQMPDDPVTQRTADCLRGISVVSLGERKYERLPKLLRHMLYFTAGTKTIKWLDALDRKPHSIILYSGYSPYLIRLLPWARRNKVRILFDAVEWYTPPNLFSKLFSPYYLNIEFAMRVLLQRCDGLIVIGTYLRDYYKGKVKNLVIIPPTVDCCQIPARILVEKGQRVKFVYAGSPGKKDSLSTIISAVVAVASLGYKIQLDIAGVSQEDLKVFLPQKKQGDLDLVIRCHGLVDASTAVDLVRAADYSIIIRPNRKNVRAGFPTKFVESLSVGTPVISNLTSDLGLYLQHGFNGYVCKDQKVDSLARAILDAISTEDPSSLRKNARETAEKHFDVYGFSAKMMKII